MTSALSRGPITTVVLAQLDEAGFPVGDNGAPTIHYGWSGEPNEQNSSFTPWLTLSPLTAQPQRVPGALADTGTEWVLPYSVYLAGLTRKQTDALADRIRQNLMELERTGIVTESGSWRVMKVSCTSIGASTRVSSPYPDYYTQADSYEIWISKERS